VLEKSLARSVAVAAIVATLSLGCRSGGAQARNRHALAESESAGPSLGLEPNLDPRTANRRTVSLEPTTMATGVQHTCPVTGATLTSKGEPVPVTVRGETVLVCCPRCVKKVQQAPDKYLARVRAEIAGRPAPR
jgi:hypothetical protein